MKKYFTVFTAALVALGVRAALPQPDLVAQIHFAGGARIAAGQDYAAFANEFSSAEALALRQQVADRLAPWLAGWLEANVGVSVAGGGVKLRPLLDDLQGAEWSLEARAPQGGKVSAALAIKLDAAGAQRWQVALKAFFPAATFKQSGGWLIFDSGTGTVRLGDALAQKLSVPTAGWLSVDVNWPRLAQWFPDLKSLGLPETKLEASPASDTLAINGKFLFPDNLPLKLDAWQFPSNTVRQPLVSFTAVRGFGAWLAGQPWAQSFRLSPEVNQLFVWSQQGAPFQTYAAAPVADGGSALKQLYPELQPVVAERNRDFGFISPVSLEFTNGQITMTGTPIIAPSIKALKEPAGQFLFVSGFPLTPKTKPLPPELFTRLATKNLVFYHWEITAERLPAQLQMSQLCLMLTRHRQLNGDSPAYKWIKKIEPKLGNTVTEITQTAPDQLTFTRKAPGGLTAFELLTLADWLEAPEFPHLNLQLPPPSERMKQLRLKHLKAAAPTAPH